MAWHFQFQLQSCHSRSYNKKWFEQIGSEKGNFLEAAGQTAIQKSRETDKYREIWLSST